MGSVQSLPSFPFFQDLRCASLSGLHGVSGRFLHAYALKNGSRGEIQSALGLASFVSVYIHK